MNIVLVGEEGRAALSSVPPGAVIHAVGWRPEQGETGRAVVCHTRTEKEVAEIVSPDKVVGGNPAIWGGVKTPETPPETVSDVPKKRGRPRKVV